MADSKWAEALRADLQEAQDEESYLVGKLSDVQGRIQSIRRRIARSQSGNGSSPNLLPDNLDGMRTSRAAAKLLEAYSKQGRPEVKVGELFEALKPYRVVTSDKRSLWETPNSWKTFALSIGGNNRKMFTIKRLSPTRAKGRSAPIEEDDLISLATSDAITL